jgi:hypothetical protein
MTVRPGRHVVCGTRDCTWWVHIHIQSLHLGRIPCILSSAGECGDGTTGVSSWALSGAVQPGSAPKDHMSRLSTALITNQKHVHFPSSFGASQIREGVVTLNAALCSQVGLRLDWWHKMRSEGLWRIVGNCHRSSLGDSPPSSSPHLPFLTKTGF